jgi:hypothetical protein
MADVTIRSMSSRLEASQSVGVRSSISRAKVSKPSASMSQTDTFAPFGRESPSNFSTDAASAGRYQDALPH